MKAGVFELHFCKRVIMCVFYVVTMPVQAKNTPVTCVPDFSRSLRAEVTELKCELAHSDRNRDAFISPPALWPVEWQVTSSIK